MLNKKTLLLVLALVVAFFTLGNQASAAGNVRITNLDNDAVRIAYVYYSPGNGSTELLAPESAHWILSGWITLQPGETRYFREGYFYVKDINGKRLSWPNHSKTTIHLDHDANFLHYYYPDAKEWVYIQGQAKNLTNASFQKLKGNYNISGSAYEYRTETFNFDFRSRDSQYFKKCFSVSGQVIDYEVKASQKHGPSPSWSKPQSNQVCVLVHVQGKAPYATAAREQGYYVGKTTISYTARR